MPKPRRRGEPSPPGPMLEAALDYCSRGWPVVPLHSWTGSSCTCGCPNCSSPAKHPRTAHGLKDRTVVGDEVVSWWHRWPGANIGLSPESPSMCSTSTGRRA